MRSLVILLPLFAAPLLAQERDNILIIVADDVGVDSVRAYAEGAAPPPTRTLDALAARGVLFRNAWSNPVCSPTRACIHTGRYSYRTGVGTALPAGNELQEGEITLPEQLDARGSGYAHAAIGKWHLTNPSSGTDGPNRAGWSHYAGLLIGATVPPWSYFEWPRTVNGSTATSLVYTTTQMTDDAIAWIAAQDRPWLCYVAYNAAHTPFHAPPEHLHTQDLEGLDPDLEPIPFYLAMVEAMDTEIGRLLASLGPDLARTNVIFIGDNGTPNQVSQPPFLPGHAKGTPFEGGVNVPLIVAGPAVTAPGREIGALVGAVDLFATVLELAGAGAQPPWVRTDSVSLAGYLRDPAQQPVRTMVYAELFQGDPNTSGFATVRNARYKLIRHLRPDGTLQQFYDLAADPFETDDLLDGTLTPIERLNLVALAAELARIRTNAPAFEPYGTSACVGSAGVPAIAGLGAPTLGGSYGVALSGAAPASPAALVIGGSDAYWGAIDLPLPLALLGGGPGCFLHASIDATATAVTDAAGSASRTITVPDLPQLLGGRIHHCWLIADPSAPQNPLGIVATSGLRARPGAP
jgi:arylsulfatase A-like enzyme